MLSIIADTHTHTDACSHAFSTLSENVAAAAEKGLKAIALTEHTPGLAGAPIYFYFNNLRILPRYMHGVLLLKGAEVNIMNYDGDLDLDDEMLDRLEWVIASCHPPTLEQGTIQDITRCWMNIANNPRIDVIGHCGAPRYAFEHKPVIREFARTGKIVEINASSFEERPGSEANCKAIATLCAEYGVPVAVGSDAHYCGNVGSVGNALAMLEEIGFPESLIVNADYDRFLAVARKTSGKELTV